MTTVPPPDPDDAVPTVLALAAREERRRSLRALQLLEYAVGAPAPRRQRTWVHRVTIAVNALACALADQAHAHENSIGVLAEVALSHPDHAAQIQQLRQDLRDLAIATASVLERIEANREVGPHTDEIRDSVADLTRRIRDHHAREADLVFGTIGLVLEDDPDPIFPAET